MESLRPFKAALTLNAVAVLGLLFFVRCGISGNGNAIELRYSYPANGESNVRSFGSYFLVFNSPVGYSSSDDVRLSFPAALSASGETLFIRREDEFIPFNRCDTITVLSLSDSEGRHEKMQIRLAFRTAPGEREDNSEPSLSDTLRLNEVRDGVTGTGGASAVDVDYFTAAPFGNDSFRISVNLLSATPVFCVRMPGNTCYDIKTGQPVSFTAHDTISFYLSNKYGDVVYNTQGWYRVSMTPLH